MVTLPTDFPCIVSLILKASPFVRRDHQGPEKKRTLNG